MSAICAVFAFIASPWLGTISDAYGRKPVIIAIQIIHTLIPNFFLLMSEYFGLTLWVWIGWKSVTQGFIPLSICFAYVADFTEGISRTSKFGYLMAAFSLGSAIGPICATYTNINEVTVFTIALCCSVGGILFNLWIGESLSEEMQLKKRRQIYKNKYPGFAPLASPGPLVLMDQHVALTGLVNVDSFNENHYSVDGSIDPNYRGTIMTTFAQPLLVTSDSTSSTSSFDESQSSSTLSDSSTTLSLESSSTSEVPFNPPFACGTFWSNPFKLILILNRSNLLRCLAVIITLLILVMLGQVAVVYLYLHSRFGMDQKEHAIMNVVNSGCGVIVQSIVLRLCLKFMSNKSVMLLGLACLFASNILYAAMWTQNLVYLIAPIASLGMLCFPALTSLKANALGPDEQGAVQGALAGVRSIGTGAGPLIFNQVFALTQDTKFEGVVFYIAAALCLIAIIIGWVITEVVHQPTDAQLAKEETPQQIVVNVESGKSIQ